MLEKWAQASRPFRTKDANELLHRVLEEAAKQKKRVRLLRLGTPGAFRHAVMAQAEETPGTASRTVRALTDPDIPSIEFLLTDPFGEPYLCRMDTEGKDNWEILRIRNQILEFARGLLAIRKRRADRKRFTIAFHLADLVWNMGIVGEDLVLVRGYDKGSGHDKSVETMVLHAGLPCRIGESFINYYESVRANPDTYWVSSKHRMADFEKWSAWPSLFKGNGVHKPTAAEKKQPEYAGVGHCFFKTCIDGAAQNAELQWLSLPAHHRRSCEYFRLPQLVRSAKIPDHGLALAMERIDGPSLFEVASEIHVMGAEAPEDTALLQALARVLGVIVDQSLAALREFRAVSEHVQPLVNATPYPYAAKLSAALKETSLRLGVVLRHEIEEATRNAESLGKDLEAWAKEPFRDAHLKNRILQADSPSPRAAVVALLALTPDEVARYLTERTYDIDFETASYRVTPWDDVAHTLFFEKSGLNPLRFDQDGLATIREWWGPVAPEEEDILWKTVLARATREACRRFWYSRTMLTTHDRRYSLESRDFFLNLARFAGSKTTGYVGLKEFLDRWEDHADDFWDRVPRRDTPEGIRAARPMARPSMGPALVLRVPEYQASLLGVDLELKSAAFLALERLAVSAGSIVPAAAITTAVARGAVTEPSADKHVSEIRTGIKEAIATRGLDRTALVAHFLPVGGKPLVPAALLALSDDKLLLQFILNHKRVGYRLRLAPKDVSIIRAPQP